MSPEPPSGVDNSVRAEDPLKVRRAVIGDEAIVRELRLAALLDAPDDFNSTVVREQAMTTAQWRDWIAGGATFVVEARGVPRGIAAGVPHRDEPDAVYLISMWVHPSLRGGGAADALVDAVLTWAEERCAEVACLDVVSSNVRAQGCYERHGFRATGHTFTRERDGIVEIEMRLPLPRRESDA